MQPFGNLSNGGSQGGYVIFIIDADGNWGNLAI